MTRHVVVLGGGPAGVNMGLALMQPGFSTTIVEPDREAAERASFFLARLSGTARNVPVVTSDYASLVQADIVFDAQGDDLPDLAPHTLLIRVGPANPQTAPQPVTIHPYAPTHLRRLVEITPGQKTPTEDTQTVCDLIHAINRVPVLAPVRPSIGVRLTRCLAETANRLLLHGAIPHELDEAMVAMGCDMGLFEAQDLIGLDMLDPDHETPASLIPTRMRAEGRLGKKVGVGWYRYPGGGGAVIDPLIEDLIREEARFAGVAPQVFSMQGMQTHLVQALSEAVRDILTGNNAPDAGDIRLILRHGLGLPDGLVAV